MKLLRGSPAGGAVKTVAGEAAPPMVLTACGEEPGTNACPRLSQSSLPPACIWRWTTGVNPPETASKSQSQLLVSPFTKACTLFRRCRAPLVETGTAL